MITQEQFELLQLYRDTLPLATAAKRVGVSANTARKHLRNGEIKKAERTWRTRKDPFVPIYEDLIRAALADTKLPAKQLLSWCIEIAPERYSYKQLRSLQRRVRRWRMKLREMTQLESPPADEKPIALTSTGLNDRKNPAMCCEGRVAVAQGLCRQHYSEMRRDLLGPASCHPDRPLHHLRSGLCATCARRLQMKETQHRATCCENRPHRALGLCSSCYAVERRSSDSVLNAARASCHPSRPRYCRDGKCYACYQSNWRRQRRIASVT
jgi:hypothetical protein